LINNRTKISNEEKTSIWSIFIHVLPSLSFPVATSKEKFAVWVQGMWDQVGLVVLYPVALLKPAYANGSILCL
jgi:hypothetical protein